jgi:hypothetical protein
LGFSHAWVITEICLEYLLLPPQRLRPADLDDATLHKPTYVLLFTDAACMAGSSKQIHVNAA